MLRIPQGRNTWSISRIKVKLHFVQNVEIDPREIGSAFHRASAEPCPPPADWAKKDVLQRSQTHFRRIAMEIPVKPIANPLIVLREEFDDWAILFDPDTGDGFGLNPISVFIWKRLDGKHTAQDILRKLHETCEDVPENAEQEIQDFIEELEKKGYVGNIAR